MPRKPKGARLVWEEGSAKSNPQYVIRDGNRKRRTGTSNLEEAQSRLADYIAETQRQYGPLPADEMTVADVLEIYGREHGPEAADPARIGYAIDALVRFWKDLPVSAVKGATCRRYAASRTRVVRRSKTGRVLETRPIAPGTIRRELGTLQSAINHCHREGYLITPVQVALPAKPDPKERWLTRNEAARLLWASRKLRVDGRHLSHFILASLYTGSRKATVLGLHIDTPSVSGGHVDTERGILYRKPVGKVMTKKRQGRCRLPRRFMAHVRRWKRMGHAYVVQDHEGNRIGDIRKGWARACEIAGITDATPHTLKHTAITWMLQRGVPIWEVASYFDTSPETIERVYGHHSPNHQSQAVASFDKR